jgi:hypothetical protein
MVGDRIESELFLRKAVSVRKASCADAREELKLLAADAQGGTLQPGWMVGIRRKARTYSSAINAYEQALHNLMFFLLPTSNTTPGSKKRKPLD